MSTQFGIDIRQPENDGLTNIKVTYLDGQLVKAEFGYGNGSLVYERKSGRRFGLTRLSDSDGVLEARDVNPVRLSGIVGDLLSGVSPETVSKRYDKEINVERNGRDIFVVHVDGVVRDVRFGSYGDESPVEIYRRIGGDWFDYTITSPGKQEERGELQAGTLSDGLLKDLLTKTDILEISKRNAGLPIYLDSWERLSPYDTHGKWVYRDTWTGELAIFDNSMRAAERTAIIDRLNGKTQRVSETRRLLRKGAETTFTPKADRKPSGSRGIEGRVGSRSGRDIKNE